MPPRTRRARRTPPAPSAARTGILVAGMHRSGTSAVARVLTIAGCDLPGTLVQAKPDNAAGFWESQPVVDLNDELLAATGSCWDDWRPFERDWFASPAAGRFRNRALKVLRQEYGESRLFVLKDPRICRLLPFWTDVLSKFEARIRIVSPIRNPLDVAASLETRNGIDPFVAYLIWLRHVLDTEADSRGLPRAYVRYDQLLSDAPAAIDRICADLGLSLPRRGGPSTETDIDAFLSPGLRHHHSGDDALLSDASVSEWIKRSFRILDCWTRGQADDEHTRELDRIRTAFDAATPAFGRALQADQQAARESRALARELLTVSDRLEATREAVAERDRRLDDQNERLTESWEKLQATRHTLTERNQKLAATGKQLEAARRTLTERDQKLAATGKQLEATRHTLTERNQKLTKNWERLQAARRTLTERNRKLTENWEKLKAARHTLTERNQKLTDTWEKLKAARHTLTERNQKLTDTWQELQAARHTLTERNQKLAATGKQLEAERRTLTERNRKLAATEKQLEAERHTLTERNQELARNWERLQAARRTLTERNQKLIDTWEKLKATRRTLTERNQKLTETWRKLQAARHTLTERNRKLTATGQQLEAARRTVAGRDARIAELAADLDAARRGHLLALARRGRRFGFDNLEVVVRPAAEWLAEARERGAGQVLELRRNGRVLTRAGAPGAADDTLRIPVPPARRGVGEALYSVHDAATGVALAALTAPAVWRARRVQGAVENRPQPEIRGWLLDPDRPGRRRRVAVELDGRLRDVIVAGDRRSDIARWLGTDGRHGFLWRVPASAAESTQVNVFDADTGRPLPGSPVRVEGGKAAASGTDAA